MTYLLGVCSHSHAEEEAREEDEIQRRSIVFSQELPCLDARPHNGERATFEDLHLGVSLVVHIVKRERLDRVVWCLGVLDVDGPTLECLRRREDE